MRVGLIAALLLVSAPLVQAQAPSDDVETLEVIRGRHRRLVFNLELRRFAVADDSVLGVEPISDRELLLRGRGAGQTSFIVWFTDGTVREQVVVVRPDLRILERALYELSPGIRVEPALDRAALVLTGVVPDSSYVEAAEAIASRYLAAGARGDGGRVLIGAPDADPATLDPNAPPPDPADVRVPAEQPAGSVINLLRVEQLPQPAEARILEALRDLPGRIRVQRIPRADVPNDREDAFVLSGDVPDQITLHRALTLAAEVLDIEDADIEVVADEAGAVFGGGQGGQGGGGFGGGGQGGGGGGGFGGGGFGGGGGQGGGGVGVFFDQLRRNMGRGTILRVGEGRLLSFLEVADLPQVRVAVQLFEVNRTRLRAFDIDASVVGADFFPGTLQGAAPTPTGGTSPEDVQGVLSLMGGALTQDVQVVTDRFAFEVALQLLEAEGIARSLSEPSLTVLSGEIASVQVGGQVPVPEAFTPALGGGAQAPVGVFNSVSFQGFGVSLQIRPRVGLEDVITLGVSSQVSAPDPGLTAQLRDTTGNATGATAFETRTLQTVSRLQDGQALLMGGLISRQRSEDANFPLLFGRIPLLGKLLTDTREVEEDLELVVFVLPTIVRDPQHGETLWAFPAPEDMLRDLTDQVEARAGRR